MSVQLAYLGVIAIWSTTPLAIKLSNDSLAPLASISLRIGAALCLAVAVGLILRGHKLLQKRNWRIYLMASIGIFPNMSLVYVASQYIPSGLIAILFGLLPFFNGVLAMPLLGESFLSVPRVVALGLSIVGLGVVFSDQLSGNANAYIGIGLMLISNLLFSLSSLGLKRLTQHGSIDAVEQTVGSMAFALPGLLLSWWLMDGNTALDFSATTLWSLLYLAVFGSLVGFFAYFYILKHMDMAAISVIPLMTPVIAVILGALIAGEQVTLNTLLGGSLIVIALALYQGVLGNLWQRMSPSQ
ncbi:MAG: DMT family transporter [Pseudomonadota bacterium]|nr:DMT family transporter [Pseudomonadota bacterium]